MTWEPKIGERVAVAVTEEQWERTWPTLRVVLPPFGTHGTVVALPDPALVTRYYEVRWDDGTTSVVALYPNDHQRSGFMPCDA